MAINFRRSKRYLTAGTAGFFATLLMLTGCSADAPSNSSSDKSSDSIIDDAACERNKAAGPIGYISGYGYSASAGQMDVFIAEELGYFDDVCLDVEINAGGANGQQLVASGQAQFTALGSASDVMLAAANSKNLTAVATYGSTSPFAIFGNEKLDDLKDLEGGKLGYFINLTPMASEMLDKADVDTSKVEMIKMTNYDPTVVVRGQVDAIVGYASNQVTQLEAADEPFSVFYPDDYGVKGTYNVMEANSRFLEENRDVASDFMRAELKALNYCLDNSEKCIDMLSGLAEEAGQGDAFSKDQLTRTWDVESEWVRNSTAGFPGVQTAEEWQPEYEIVQKHGDLDDLPSLESMMDNDLVPALYDDEGAVEWSSK